MKKTELAKLCNLSRQTIYNLMIDNYTEFDILSRYTRPLKKNEISLVDISSLEREIFNKGILEGYQKAKSKLEHSDKSDEYLK